MSDGGGEESDRERGVRKGEKEDTASENEKDIEGGRSGDAISGILPS